MHEIRLRVAGEAPPTLARKPGRNSAGSGSINLAEVAIRREETRRTNQRREDRHLNLAGRAVITFRRRKFEVDVVNVSSHGAMIEAAIEPRLGERIDIRFEDCNPTRCAVRWVKDRRIGLEFADETVIIAPRNVRDLIVSGRREGEQPKLTKGRARAPRQHLIWRGTLHWVQGEIPVRLHNISAEGAMLQAGEDVPDFTSVVLELAGADAIAAQVRWCRSGHIGIRFDEKYDLARLAHAEPEVHSPDMLKPDYLRSETDPDSPWAARWERLNREDL